MGQIEIIRAEKTDLEQILKVQYVAFLEEAAAFSGYSIEPLSETKDDLLREFSYRTFLKAVHNEIIVGSVRAHIDGDTTYIDKLIVHPDCQNKGLGSRLLSSAESLFPYLHKM